MKAKLNNISGAIATLALIAFGGALVVQGIQQNLATWIMWVVMDILITASMLFAGSKGSWKLPAGYTVGAAIVAGALVYRGATWYFGGLEVFSAAAAAFCIWIWIVSGPKVAVVSSTLAMTFAGLPALWNAWVSPDPRSWWLWGIIGISCFLSTVAGRAWTIEERFFPACSLSYQTIMLYLVLR